MQRRRGIRGRGLPNVQRQKATDAVHEGRSEHHRNPHHAKPAVCRGDIQNGLCGERQQIKSPAALMPDLDTLGSSTVPWEFRLLQTRDYTNYGSMSSIKRDVKT